MSFFRKTERNDRFPPDQYTPVIRCSICTGEQVAGFREKTGGRFIAVTLLRDGHDLDEFRRKYGITGEIEKIY
jgi:Sulfite reductase, alpha subunit (flavoprotein)